MSDTTTTTESTAPEAPASEQPARRLRLPGRGGSAGGSQLFRNAYALMLNTGISAVLGLGFWLAAARYYSESAVGQSSAAIAAMKLLAGLTAVTLTGALARFIPVAGRRTGQLIFRTYAGSSLIVALAAGVFLLTLGVWGPSYRFLHQPLDALGFVVAVVAWNLLTLQDGVLTGLRSAPWVPVGNTVFSAVKLGLLVAFSVAIPVTGVFVSWVAAIATSVVPLGWLVFRRLVPRHVEATAERAAPPTLREIGRFLAGDYTGSLFSLAVVYLIPVIIASQVSSEDNAYFYITTTIGGTVNLLAINMGASLTVEGSHDPARLAANTRAALRRMARIMLPICGLLFLGAPWILGVFGAGYADAATPLLRWFAVGALLRVVMETYFAVLRAQSRTAGLAWLQGLLCVLVLGLTLLLLPRMGLTGAGVAEISSLAVIVTIAAPRLWRTLRVAPAAVPEDTAPDGDLADLGTREVPATDRPRRRGPAWALDSDTLALGVHVDFDHVERRPDVRPGPGTPPTGTPHPFPQTEPQDAAPPLKSPGPRDAMAFPAGTEPRDAAPPTERNRLPEAAGLPEKSGPRDALALPAGTGVRDTVAPKDRTEPSEAAGLPERAGTRDAVALPAGTGARNVVAPKDRTEPSEAAGLPERAGAQDAKALPAGTGPGDAVAGAGRSETADLPERTGPPKATARPTPTPTELSHPPTLPDESGTRNAKALPAGTGPEDAVTRTGRSETADLPERTDQPKATGLSHPPTLPNESGTRDAKALPAGNGSRDAVVLPVGTGSRDAVAPTDRSELSEAASPPERAGARDAVALPAGDGVRDAVVVGGIGLPVEEREPGAEASVGPAEVALLRKAETGAPRTPDGPPPPSLRERLTPTRSGVVLGCLLVAALLLYWVPALRLGESDLDRMGGLGLVSVLPPATLAGAALLVTVFAALLWPRREHRALLLVTLLATVVSLHALPAVIETEPRFATAWQHLGFIDYINRTGSAVPDLDARWSWPGFFAVAAFVGRACGVTDFTEVIRWWPTAIQLAYLAPMFLLVRSLRASWRAKWTGVWIFVLGGWVGQDYFSPQGFTYLLYLMFVAILLVWFRAPRMLWTRFRPGEAEVEPAGRRQRAVLLMVLIGLYAASVPAHQLTPFMMLGVLAVLVLTGRSELRGLPVLCAVLVAAWLGFMAEPYWSGHFDDLFGGIGGVGSNVSTSVSGRIQDGSSTHKLVLYARVLLAGGVLALACWGWLRRRRNGYRERSLPVLALVPFLGFGMQSYGGEMALRVFMFALPGAALLGALALFPRAGVTGKERAKDRRSLAPVAALLAGLLLMGGFLVARWGNEPFERIRPGEVAAMDYVYAHDKPTVRLLWLSNDTVNNVTPAMPWGAKDMERVDYVPTLAPADPALVSGLVKALKDAGPQSYLMVNGSQVTYLRMDVGYAPDWPQRLVRTLDARPELTKVLGNRDVTMYALREQPPGPVPKPDPGPIGPQVTWTPWSVVGALAAVFLAVLLTAREAVRVAARPGVRQLRWLQGSFWFSLPLLAVLLASLVLRFVTMK
ncbi:lipopolysaccharide biosynthesis protein [Streptomyces sp. NPDC026672]|uniref:lipopolysaccharide biosynthesis protein n=1 Tax=unclassified Streptomyces TaxID=2593676 RepID=UPI0033D8C488